MATVKSYSVADTQGAGTNANTSSVYSIQLGRQQSYDHSDDQNMQEGRRATLVNKGNRAAVANDVATLEDPTVAGEARPNLAGEQVIATTTTVVYDAAGPTYTYPQDGGAGLIVLFTVGADGVLPDFGSGQNKTDPSEAVGNHYTIIDPGEGYAGTSTVTIDGWNRSVVGVGV